MRWGLPFTSVLLMLAASGCMGGVTAPLFVGENTSPLQSAITPTARVIADARHAFMTEFFKRLALEVRGES